MQRLVGGSHSGVGVAMPQSLRDIGVTREGLSKSPPGWSEGGLPSKQTALPVVAQGISPLRDWSA